MAQHPNGFEFAVCIAGRIETDSKHLALACGLFVTAFSIIKAFIKPRFKIACMSPFFFVSLVCSNMKYKGDFALVPYMDNLTIWTRRGEVSWRLFSPQKNGVC